ncbi:MAG: sugar phosphate isomerase/epimerase, partial [Candidatus Pacebacteria bacterium]|nr:sugar phosphate isomerase/epimerase [Candidatus Paceibacterota bacterium]
KERRIENAVKAVREMAKIAEMYGVVLADEPVNRFESETINTVEEELGFLDRVDSPWVKTVVDTFHMNIEEDDLISAILYAGKRIAHVHLAENNRKLPGNGHLDWRSILKALNDIGYTSYLTMESFQIPYAAISDSMCIWRDLCTVDIDEDVKNAVAYLKGIMNDIS